MSKGTGRSGGRQIKEGAVRPISNPSGQPAAAIKVTPSGNDQGTKPNSSSGKSGS